jgi:hypothetical protein
MKPLTYNDNVDHVKKTVPKNDRSYIFIIFLHPFHCNECCDVTVQKETLFFSMLAVVVRKEKKIEHSSVNFDCRWLSKT